MTLLEDRSSSFDASSYPHFLSLLKEWQEAFSIYEEGLITALYKQKKQTEIIRLLKGFSDFLQHKHELLLKLRQEESEYFQVLTSQEYLARVFSGMVCYYYSPVTMSILPPSEEDLAFFVTFSYQGKSLFQLFIGRWKAGYVLKQQGKSQKEILKTLAPEFLPYLDPQE